MINKIGIENFRIFKEYTEFELKPITLLTGPNNAGKSSFTKLLLLLKNGIQKLNFTEGMHNLESFDKVLNWDLKEKILKIDFNCDIEYFNDFTIQNYYVNEVLNKIIIRNKNIEFIQYSITEDENSNDDLAHNTIVNVNINYLIDFIYNKELKCKLYENRLPEIKYDEFYDELIEIIPHKVINLYELPVNNNNDLHKVEFHTEINDNDPSNDKYINPKNIHYYALNNEINNLVKDYLIYNVLVNDENITVKYKNEIVELQVMCFNNLEFFEWGNELSIESLKKNLPEINSQVKSQISSFFKNKLNEQKVQVIETGLGNLIFNQKLISNNNFPNLITNNTLFEKLVAFDTISKQELDGIEYISANRGSQKRVLSNRSDNEIDAIVVAFYNKSKENRAFFNEILEILEIDGKIEIERYENTISVVYLQTKDRKIALADLGFGFSQLFPIIMKIIMCFNENTTLIIEEPEANLHPNLQSKLADVFVACIKFNSGLKLIIETHSEYFIRKLQYLTKAKKITTEESVIYYFNADKYVTPQEPKVKKIEIRENGSLSDIFGPGFYDETSTLQFELYKLNNAQIN
jgi:predicted ATPase